MDEVLVFIDAGFLSKVSNYFGKKRNGFFSTSNELMKTVDRCVLIEEGDFRR